MCADEESTMALMITMMMMIMRMLVLVFVWSTRELNGPWNETMAALLCEQRGRGTGMKEMRRDDLMLILLMTVMAA